MAKKKSNIKTIVAAAKKIAADKKSIIAYSKGEISKKELNERGVKLTMPL